VAAASVTIVAGAGIALMQRTSPTSVDRPAATQPMTPIWIAPTPVPPEAPTPGSVIPHVADSESWASPLSAALREGGQRSGTWVSTALAVRDGDGYGDPIEVSAFDGTFTALEKGVLLTGDDTISTVRIGAWQAVWTNTTPTLLVAGEADQSVLVDVLRSSSIVTNGDEFTVAVATRGDGYEQVGAPQLLAVDTVERRSLAGEAGTLSINEVSDWVDSRLYAATTGADITPTALANGNVGWTGIVQRDPGASPTRFVAWSPSAGVVFEIVSADPARSIDDLIALANLTEPISSTEWDTLYP